MKYYQDYFYYFFPYYEYMDKNSCNLDKTILQQIDINLFHYIDENANDKLLKVLTWDIYR